MKKEAEEYENAFCTLFFYNGRLLDAIAGKEGEGLRRDRLAADHDGDGRRAGDRRCGADTAHGLGGRDHLLRCKDSFPDGETAGLCFERPGQCRESGRIVSRNGDIGSRGLTADGVQGRLQAGKLCRRTLGGRHQHDVTGVGILALHTLLPQSLRQLLAGKTQRGGVQRQLEGLAVRPGEGECQPGPEGIQLPAEHPQPPAADVQLLPEAVGQNRVGGVQRPE